MWMGIAVAGDADALTVGCLSRPFLVPVAIPLRRTVRPRRREGVYLLRPHRRTKVPPWTWSAGRRRLERWHDRFVRNPEELLSRRKQCRAQEINSISSICWISPVLRSEGFGGGGVKIPALPTSLELGCLMAELYTSFNFQVCYPLSLSSS